MEPDVAARPDRMTPHDLPPTCQEMMAPVALAPPGITLETISRKLRENPDSLKNNIATTLS